MGVGVTRESILDRDVGVGCGVNASATRVTSGVKAPRGAMAAAAGVVAGAAGAVTRATGVTVIGPVVGPPGEPAGVQHVVTGAHDAAPAPVGAWHASNRTSSRNMAVRPPTPGSRSSSARRRFREAGYTGAT